MKKKLLLDISKILFDRTITVVLFFLLIAVLQAGFAKPAAGENTDKEEVASFDEKPDSVEKHPHATEQVAQGIEKFNIKLYLDFMYEQCLGSESEETSQRDPEKGSFGSNHTFLLVTANPTENIRVGFDITFKEYYELEYAITPHLFIKGGLIFLPFGDFRYHSVYGGKVYSINNDLFPNWFTDYGIALEHELLDLDNLHLKYGLFVSNGFQESLGGQVNMNSIGFSEDNNNQKAIGGRVKTTLFGGYSVTVSGMKDYWSDNGKATLRLLALECATVRGLINIPFFNRLNLKFGYLDNHVENEDAAEEESKKYNGYGYYGELSFKAARWLKLTYRMGGVDPNENVDNEKDQLNHNIRAIFSLNRNLQLWAMYQWNDEKYGEEINNDYLMIKSIVVF